MTKNTGTVKKGQMTEKLETILDNVSAIRSPVNPLLIQEFYQCTVGNRKSDRYKKNNLKALALFSQELARNITFYDIQNKEKTLEFLNKESNQKVMTLMKNG